MSKKHDPAKARSMAIETAKLNGIGADAVKRHIDTQFPNNPPCYVIMTGPNYAVVVYEDDWDTTVSTGNHAGRFVEQPETVMA